MKYTRSKDGVERVTLRVEARLDRAQLKDLRAYAKAHGYATVHGLLETCLHDGITERLDHLRDEED